MTIFSAIILGIIEGLTEFLPVSSTGHLILASHLLELSETSFIKSFNIIIQLGAILAVLVLYWRRLLVNARILGRVVAAFLPTAVVGLLVYPLVKSYLLDNVTVVIWALLLGGLFLIFFEKKFGEKPEALADLEKLSWTQSVLIGLAQSVAIIPGVSRSAATIVVGLALGLSRAAVVEFSFLLAIPTLAAATGLDLIKSSANFTTDQIWLLVVGLVTSFVVAILAIKTFLAYVRQNDFELFGLYRVILALIFMVVFFL